MNTTRLRLLPLLLPLFLIVLLATSCQKDPYELGVTLLPDSDTLHLSTNDTSTVVAYSMVQDSIRTDETTTNFIGSLQDPVFGNTTAGFYAQLRLSAEAPDFGTNPVLDSAVMIFTYAGIYGDTNAVQNLKVYEISQDLDPDTSYYSIDRASTYPNLLADFNFVPNPIDSVLIDSVKLGPQLRVNLSNITKYWGNKILYAPEDALSSNASFLTYMKGLHFETTPRSSGGALIALSPTASTSKLILYFHNDTEDSLQFNLLINAKCARFNTFNHNNYIGAEPTLRNQIVNNDTALGREKLYLQGLGGVKIRFRLPHILNYRNVGKIALNSAVLYLKNFESDTTLKPPSSLTLMVVDSAGKIGFLIDEEEGTTYFGGTYNKSTRTYEFRITRHLQRILNGTETNYDLQLMVNDPTVNGLYPYRIVLNGTNPTIVPPSDRMQLKLVYSKLLK